MIRASVDNHGRGVREAEPAARVGIGKLFGESGLGCVS